MTRFKTLAWAAAISTYFLIVLGAVVRISHSGMGCGDHWPLCNGHFFPPLDDIGTVIEWSHRLMATLVSVLVVALALYDWWLQRRTGVRVVRPSFIALALLIVQVLLGAVTVKLELPAWSVVLHLGTAMLLLATLLAIAASPPGPLATSWRGGTLVLVSLAFVTVLFGALTANVGAAAACGGFPLCNGQIWITAGPLAWIQWMHRLLAYTLAVSVVVWAFRTPARAPRVVVGLIAIQIAIGAATVLLGLPRGLQAAHVAMGALVWAGIVLSTMQGGSVNTEAPAAAPGPR